MQPAYSAEDFISKLTKKGIRSYDEIPEDIHNNPDIIKITRNLGLRKVVKCGYDVISSAFFVEEIIIVTGLGRELFEKDIVNIFQDFKSYYEFLNGDIYNNACYFQYNFSPDIIKEFNLETTKLNMQSDLDYTIDDCLPELSESEKAKYQEIESQMPLRKSWIKKYNACTTYKQLSAVNKKHQKSEDRTHELFYLWNYINYHGEKSFKTIMNFVCSGEYPRGELENALVFLYGAERVLDSYDYTGDSPSTNKKHNAQFKNTVQEITKTEVESKTVKFFDKQTHYFCVKTKIYSDNYLKICPVSKRYKHLVTNPMIFPIAELYKYFDTFDEFAEYLDNDLSDCDLSNAIDLNIDYSKFKTNTATKLPIHAFAELKKLVSKMFNRIKQQFEVVVTWYSIENIEVYKREFTFKYFFDFIAFLKNDLSESDLLYCDGLQNLLDFSEIKFTNAKLRSFVFEKLGINQSKSKLLNTHVEIFIPSANNEIETTVVLKNNRDELSEYKSTTEEKKIYYITDLHLMHRLYNANVVTDEDCIYVIQSIIDTLLETVSYRSIILIGGDISSDFSVFKLFVKLLRKTMNEYSYCNRKVIFTLGNHELWEFPEETLDSIVSKYRTFLLENDMYLLQNEILYCDGENNIECISQHELYELSIESICSKLHTARTIFFGGIGFSGYNQEFNANNGIYRKTLSREEEIIESNILEELYDKLCTCLYDKNVIVFTHMPFTDWHKNKSYQNSFVYVSGHNHRNCFYDDGNTRIYADNQVGYHSEHPRLKYFYINNTYDWFSEYENGIHQINRNDYINFYHGKNLPLTFNRNIHKLYMLKKENYYCFIHENASGGLTILNGGSLSSLKFKDIEYYYDNIDIQIAHIKNPLDKFYQIQLQVSKAIKEIGGDGNIHGAIVDIDYFNHIYINPNDLTMTPYFAWDMIEKYAYPSVPALLKAKCPILFSSYSKILCTEKANALAIIESDTDLTVKPKLYLSTDIYVASRILKKMQKLNNNILTIWNDNIPEIKTLPSE